jgi:two-component system OmpR family sensor kinase
VSLRTRLLLALGAVALVALIAADLATYSSLKSFLISRVDEQLDTTHDAVLQAMYHPSGPPNGPVPEGTQPGGSQTDGNSQPGAAPDGDYPDTGSAASNFQRLAPGTFVALLQPNGSVVTQQPYVEEGGKQLEPKLPAHLSSLAGSGERTPPRSRNFDASAVQAGSSSFRVSASQIPGGDILVVALPLSGEQQTLDRLLNIELAVTGGALILAGLIGWWMVRVGLRPLSAIERTAAAISQGELGRRVPGETPKTEVGRLARVINSMLGRIEGAFAAREATLSDLRRSEGTLRRFVSDASHELRTPLAAVSAYAELFERGANQRPEDLTRVIAGIRAETARMGHLVDDLLLLARMDEGRPLERVQVELVGLAAEAVHAAAAVGPEWELQLEASEPVEVVGDPARLRQVIDNLLANVRAHTPPGTTAKVKVDRMDDRVVLRVADDGPGIPPEEAERLFERFYRADQSRSRSSGGSGLGLSIVWAIVSAHGGTVSASPGDGGGSVFTVTLPVPPSNAGENIIAETAKAK